MTSALSKRSEIFYYFSGFCSPESDCLVRDLAIFRLKRNEQYSSIPKIKKNH